MSKHTPGPWWISEIDEGKGNPAGISIDAKDKRPRGIAEICEVWGIIRQDIHTQESEANARLIAAAPDLLEALKRTERRLTILYAAIAPQASNSDSTNGFADMDEAVLAARAAIAKAEG